MKGGLRKLRRKIRMEGLLGGRGPTNGVREVKLSSVDLSLLLNLVSTDPYTSTLFLSIQVGPC